MAAWHTDKGLAVLIKQVKAKNSGMTVYVIGDAKHSARTSDHNPKANGCVCAADFMIRGAFSRSDAVALANVLASHKDSRLKYVIYNRKIYSKKSGVWAWRKYTGTDPHTDHVHVSVYESAKVSAWSLGTSGGAVAPAVVVKSLRGVAYPGAVKSGTKGAVAGKWQAELKADGYAIGVDNDFGPKSVTVLRAAQKKHGVPVDGQGGPVTWKKLK